MNTSISKSGVKSFLDGSFNSVISENIPFQDSRETEGYGNDSFLSRGDLNPNDVSMNPPIVVIESSCTVTDHLKVGSLSHRSCLIFFLSIESNRSQSSQENIKRKNLKSNKRKERKLSLPPRRSLESEPPDNDNDTLEAISSLIHTKELSPSREAQ
jgi:hypothetical protein